MSDDEGPQPVTREGGRRRRVGVIVLVVGVIVGLAVVAAGAYFVTTRKPPLDAANAYFGDLSAGDFTGAYDRLCERSQAAVTEEQYVASLERNLAGIFAIEGYSANPFTVNVNGSRASVDLEVSYAAVGGDDVTIDLRKEDGDWRPCPDADPFTMTSAPTTTAPPTTTTVTTATTAPAEPAAT